MRLAEWLEDNRWLMIWTERADSSGFEDWRGVEVQIIVRRRYLAQLRLQRMLRQG